MQPQIHCRNKCCKIAPSDKLHVCQIPLSIGYVVLKNEQKRKQLFVSIVHFFTCCITVECRNCKKFYLHNIILKKSTNIGGIKNFCCIPLCYLGVAIAHPTLQSSIQQKLSAHKKARKSRYKLRAIRKPMLLTR